MMTLLRYILEIQKEIYNIEQLYLKLPSINGKRHFQEQLGKLQRRP